MLEFNVTVSFPAAPLLTVILALVGKYILLNYWRCKDLKTKHLFYLTKIYKFLL